MQENEVVTIDGLSLLGVKVNLPNAPVLMLVGAEGFVGCGYFSTEVANKVSHALAVVSGVSSFHEMLEGTVKAVSTRASELGIGIGMSGADAAKLLA